MKVKYKQLQSITFVHVVHVLERKVQIREIPEVFSRSAKIKAPVRCHGSYRRQCLTALKDTVQQTVVVDSFNLGFVLSES